MNDILDFAAISAYKGTTDAVALVLTYLRDNVDLARPLSLSHLKHRAVGHWGCTPGITAIWGAAAAAVTAAGRPARLLVGTGHAGLAWTAAAYTDGSLTDMHPQYTQDVNGLLTLARDFGAYGGLATEVSHQYPGALWCGGELGHAVGVCHGIALADPEQDVIVVIGDGELETVTTTGAIQALRAFPAPNLHIVVNDNGMRMGGTSALGHLADTDSAAILASLANAQVEVCEDLVGLGRALTARLTHSAGGRDPGFLFYRNLKGEGLPALNGGPRIAGTVLAHKAPVKRIRTPDELSWLDNCLRRHGVERLFDRGGRLDTTRFQRILPRAGMRLTETEPRRAAVAAPRSTSGARASMVDVLTGHIAAIGGRDGIVVTSPDELSSNRCDSLLRAEGVTIREYLSEHVCLYQNLGESLVGRDSWMIAYEAFADLTLSTVLQHLKQFQDCGVVLRRPGTIHLALTSLGWRNAYSHQAPGFVTSVLQARPRGVRVHLPADAAGLRTALASDDPDVLIRIYVFDKYDRPHETPILSDVVDRQVTLVTFGDYLVPQATAAARVLRDRLDARVAVQPIEEVTFLYRQDDAADLARRRLRDHVGDSRVVLLSSGYPDVLSSLWTGAVGRFPDAVRGFVGQPNCTSGSSLLAAGCTWMQIARTAAGLLASGNPDPLLQSLAAVEDRLRAELDGAWDDPDWFTEPVAADFDTRLVV